MKSIYQNTPEPIQYPCLLESLDGEVIVLANSPNTGTVVSVLKGSGYQVGEYRPWVDFCNQKIWKLASGQVVLKN